MNTRDINRINRGRNRANIAINILSCDDNDDNGLTDINIRNRANVSHWVDRVNDLQVNNIRVWIWTDEGSNDFDTWRGVNRLHDI